MPLTLGDKTTRVIRFLLGLRNPRIATALASYGLTEADMAEGWSLVNDLGKGKLAVFPIQARDMQSLQKLDAWENHWFPIAGAALERRYPAVHARLFLNLSQAEGPEVAVTVRTFVDRYAELVDPQGPYGAEGPKAKDHLAVRGITPGIVEEARGLLAALAKVMAPTESVTTEEQEAALARAEDALWAWYLEWSRVARVAIKQRMLLRQLGFLSSRGGEAADEAAEPAEAPVEAAKPAA